MVNLHLLPLFSALSLYPLPSATLPTSGDCRTTLSCTFTQFAAMTMSTRLDYLRTMESSFFAPLNASSQFRPIEGVIEFFIQNNLGAPESWASYVDAGILEGIQNGGAVALGLTQSSGDANPGTVPWASFLTSVRDAGFASRDAHDKAWSVAEQAATDYGKTIADAKFAASVQEKRWYLFSQLFRTIMRNRADTVKVCKVAALANPLTWGFANRCGELVDWLTDVTDMAPTLCLSKTAWDIVDPNVNVLELPAVFGKILGELVECFEQN